MQVYSSLPTNHFTFNTKKRSRPDEDNVVSHYLKKRLIRNTKRLNTLNNDTDINLEENRDDTDINLEENKDDTNNTYYHKDPSIQDSHIQDQSIQDSYIQDSHIQLLDINGTVLPFEQKPGKPDYSIPNFILKDDKPLSDDSNKQLILYRRNPLLPVEDDNESVTSEENDEEFEAMDLD